MVDLLYKFLNKIKNKKIIICGLGLSNTYLIKLLFEFGISITVYDSKIESKIDPEIIKYIKLNRIKHRFGSNYIDDMDCDIIIRTPGISYLSPMILKARENNTVITSEIEIFFDLCPCKTIGITGSDGKTTVTTIISEILKNSGRKVFTGGNIGIPLLPKLNKIKENDIVVAELSSFQLMSMRKSPDIAVVTNLSPNHLDVHHNMEEYINSKKNIILHQDAFCRAVLNYDNNITRKMIAETRGEVLFFSRKAKISNGAWINQNKEIVFSKSSKDTIVMNLKDIKITGEHNLENYLAAISAIWGYTDIESIKNTAKKFSGVEHRMELVRVINGVSFYNDSIATSPTRVISGCLSLFSQKIILIVGGYDKNIPFKQMGNMIPKKVKIIILLGNTSPKIENAIKNSPYYNYNNPTIIKVNSMEEAVNQASLQSTKGDIVALSPACASFDMYKNFEEKGNHFKKLVLSLKEE